MKDEKWISITERLPTKQDANEDEKVLAALRDSFIVGPQYWYHVNEYSQCYLYWMSYPSPPKGE